MRRDSPPRARDRAATVCVRSLPRRSPRSPAEVAGRVVAVGVVGLNAADARGAAGVEVCRRVLGRGAARHGTRVVGSQVLSVCGPGSPFRFCRSWRPAARNRHDFPPADRGRAGTSAARGPALTSAARRMKAGPVSADNGDRMG
jgi:hypothetical protein